MSSPYAPRPGWPDEHMTEAAMGLISNAADWGIANPNEPAPEWVQAARGWLRAYQRATVLPTDPDYFQPAITPDSTQLAEPSTDATEAARLALAEIREAAEQKLAELTAGLAAAGSAGASEGDNPRETVSEPLRAEIEPEPAPETGHRLLLDYVAPAERGAYAAELGHEFGRRFALVRHRDISGISGTGVVARGIEWPDGSVEIRWSGERPSSVHWNSLDDAVAIHGHGGATEFVWADPKGVPE